MMKKLKPLNFIITFLMIGIFAFSQETEIQYTYDVSGNRIQRQTIVLPAPTNDFNLDSLKVEETILQSKISIFPNPTHGELNVVISGDVDFKQSSISIFTMDGSLLQHIEPAKQDNRLSLFHASPGMYILRLIIKGKTESWKIIKQ